ncbi:nuclear transport factor 2 family protein [Actinomadura rayongensis]|uniref:Nuclear transport factor 2 family protein n=1 Tax=Actinomadura rayongensis TaxID=1429076 RepID=A0A6I4W7R8_9ACTN|nr:nuclear transport factor 2 family protein [Actinomadura rayongensis]MXQ65511.1 nuclear transport factor 2 family protein [Actinomadura rayongensis]
MSDVHELVERYLAAWNETDPAARRAAVEAVFADGAVYVDPLAVAEGRDALDATIGAVQGQFPGFVFRLVGAVDAHHDIARFTWELGPADGPAPIEGFDVAEIADGRFVRVNGFLNRVPG